LEVSASHAFIGRNHLVWGHQFTAQGLNGDGAVTRHAMPNNGMHPTRISMAFIR
jgi:hypothetical protein